MSVLRTTGPLVYTFDLFADNVFLEAFREQGIDLILGKLTSATHPPTIQELAQTVSRRLLGEPDSTSSSD